MASSQQNGRAIPLVLPNNCTWNEQTGEYSTNLSIERKTLDLQPKALDQLRKIKADVCVVSIAGPYRTGKSYILAKALDQRQVFTLGHELKAETMGIWLWIVPEKFKDQNGREFTVVLLDSEGLNSAQSDEKSNDHRIFTLSVLLSSIMIYNSSGVVNRSDVEGLDFIVNLSQRIRLSKDTENDAKHFYEAFPYFIWTLRDVALAIPKGCKNIKEYFTKEIFRTGANEKPNKVAESILTVFSGFDAFDFPIPSSEPEVMRNLDAREAEVNPAFLKKVQEFKHFLRPKLSPKRSINEGEFVTGEALAVLVQLFVNALNTPGAVPNVQNAWDTVVLNKCIMVLDEVFQEYEKEMLLQVEKQLPCDAEEIRAIHDDIIEISLQKFKQETSSLSMKSVDEYLTKLTDKANPILTFWLEKNRKMTEDICSQLIKRLKKDILDPVLARLRSSEGSKMEFGDIINAYNQIEKEYTKNARGAKEVQATVFLSFHPELQKDMEQNVDLLKQLKNYDENQTKEKAVSAKLEEQRLKMKEENARKDEEMRNKERELLLLREKQEEEMKRLKEIFEKKQVEIHDQMQNMLEAEFKERRREREEQMVYQSTLDKKIEMIQSDMDRKLKIFEDIVEKTWNEKERMQDAFDIQMRDANVRKEYLKKTIYATNEDRKKEREAASATQQRLQETIYASNEDREKERAAARESQERLQDTLKKDLEDRRHERAAAMAREDELKETIRRKEKEKADMRDKHFMIRKIWK